MAPLRLLLPAFAVVAAACSSRIPDGPKEWPPSTDAGGSAVPGAGMTPESYVLWRSDDAVIYGLAAAGDRVYVVTLHHLTSLARDGSDEKVLAETTDDAPYNGGIAVNDTDVYWGGVSNVYSVPRAGGAVRAYASQGPQVGGIALDASNAYWVTEGYVQSMPLGGGPTTLLAPTQWMATGAFALAGGSLYWSLLGSAQQPDATALQRMPVAGGAPQTLGTDLALALHPDGNGGVAWIQAEPVDGGPAQTIAIADLLPGASSPRYSPLIGFDWVDQYATDGTRWYFVDERTGVLYVLDPQASSPRALTSPVYAATAAMGDGPSVVVDGREIFWSQRAGAVTEQFDANALRGMPLP